MRIETGQVVSKCMKDCLYFIKEGFNHGGFGIPEVVASLGKKEGGKELFMFVFLGLYLSSALLSVLVVLQSSCASEFDLKSSTRKDVRLFCVTAHGELQDAAFRLADASVSGEHGSFQLVEESSNC